MSPAGLPPGLTAGAILRRVRDMALLWLVFGAALGSRTDLARRGGVIGLVSGVLAGMIVMPILGVGLGLAGGQVRPTFIGALFGSAFAGTVAAVSDAANPLSFAGFGIVLGGLVGGTISLVLWWTNFLTRVLALPLRGR